MLRARFASQEALDRIEVCLGALQKPVSTIRYAVDLGNLPNVPIPALESAQDPAPASDAEDSRAPEDGLPSADETDDTAPEELGDSTHEAQNRGECSWCSSTSRRGAHKEAAIGSRAVLRSGWLRARLGLASC